MQISVSKFKKLLYTKNKNISVNHSVIPTPKVRGRIWKMTEKEREFFLKKLGGPEGRE